MKLFEDFYGFKSIGEFWSGLTSPETFKIQIMMAIPAVSLSIFNEYLWDDFRAVIILFLIIMAKFFTGVAYVIKQKEFEPMILFKTPIYILTTFAMLFMSYNMAYASKMFYPLPGALYGGFCSVYFLGFVRNIGKLQWLPLKASKFLAENLGWMELKKNSQ